MRLVTFVTVTRDAPLYLEWAPGNILSQNISSVDNSDKNIVGQHDLKRILLEEQTGRLTDAELILTELRC